MTARWRRALAKIALLVLSLLLSLALIEVAMTAWYGELGRCGPYELVDEWDSPFVFRARRSPENPLSLRRSVPTLLERRPGTLRVLSYGDSIAGGYGVAETDTYAHRIEAALGAAGRPAEILNMARGHSPSVYAFHLRSDVPRLRPDGVIVQIELMNDVSDETLARTSGRDEDGLPLEIHAHRYLVGWDGHLLAPLSFRGSLLERTKVYAKVTRWYGRLREKLTPNPLLAEDSGVTYYSLSADRYLLTEPALEQGWDRLFDALAGMHAYVRRHDARFLVLIVPSRHVFGEGRYAPFARELVARAEARARLLGLPYLTPEPELRTDGGAALFMDFCHPTAQGNAAIARALTPVIAGW